MKITAWRIAQSAYADDAFTGLGAWLEGARWNHKGTHLVYAAASISLAALEMVVQYTRTYLKKNVSAHGKAQNGEKAEHTRSM